MKTQQKVSWLGWYENKEDPVPFIKYILRTILAVEGYIERHGKGRATFYVKKINN